MGWASTAPVESNSKYQSKLEPPPSFGVCACVDQSGMRVYWRSPEKSGRNSEILVEIRNPGEIRNPIEIQKSV